MILTGSSMKEFQVCPQRWAFQFLENKVPRVEPVPFTSGKLYHSFVEGMLLGESMTELLSVLRNRAEVAASELDGMGRFEKATSLRGTWACMEQVAPFWKDRFAGPTVCVEQVMTAPLGTLPNGELVQFTGIPDRIRRIQGKLVHTQTRTLNSSTPLVPYLKAFQRNTHELLYAWLIQTNMPDEPYFGSELQVFLKAKMWSDRKCKSFDTKWHAEKARPDCPDCHYENDGRVRTQLHTPEELLIQELVPIDQSQVQRALQDAMQVAFSMQRIRDGEQPVQNRDADLGKFGNSLCSYFDVCTGEAELKDEGLFKQRENRYEPVAEEENEAVGT